jgi:predicted RNase H-like nuclease
MRRILGIDLAWGERKPDGVCALEVSALQARVLDLGLTQGDEALLEWVAHQMGEGASLLAVDAPLVCPNAQGSRPVDRLTHVHFGRFYAGCHPANLSKCPRPVRVTEQLVQKGYRLGWNLEMDIRQEKLLAEVYPHPAMIRLFHLDQRIPYKRGRVIEKRQAFRRLQKLIQSCLATYFPQFQLDPRTLALLRSEWTKNIEDQTDAFFCALIGYWHWLHRGQKTQVLGDLATGFILIPQP